MMSAVLYTPSASDSPSPLMGEGLGRGCRAASAAHMTLAEIRARKSVLLERARTMRANPTDAERKLWQALRATRLSDRKWKRQAILGDRYIVDFICLDAQLIVEADGSQHADSRGDIRRDAWLAGQGFRVLRFWNNDVLNSTQSVLEAILVALGSCDATDFASHPLPNPSPLKGKGL